MRNLPSLRVALMLLLFGLSEPEPGRAQIPVGPAADNCYCCGLPDCACTCPPLKPVIETRYRPVPGVAWRNVAQTGYVPRAHVETVPVTTLENVVVDEGGYRMVWVPKPVIRTVARNGYVNRLGYHLQPYRFTRRVPQLSTYLVPERRLRYVPRWAPTTSTGVTHERRTAPLDSQPATLEPRPDPAFQAPTASPVSGDWQIVNSRNGPSRTQTEPRGETNPSLSGVQPVSETTPVGRPPGRSRRPTVLAPSAAKVWQTPGVPLQ